MLKNHVIYRIEDEPTLDMNNSTPRVPILMQSFSESSYEPNTSATYTLEQNIRHIGGRYQVFRPPKRQTSSVT